MTYGNTLHLEINNITFIFKGCFLASFLYYCFYQIGFVGLLCICGIIISYKYKLSINMVQVVGLTGIIGSGKSLVAALFEKWGIKCIDTDLISHQITTNNGIAVSKIRQIFGEEYIDINGSLDRRKMRDTVFTNPDKRVVLENILHPIIFEQVINQIKDINDTYVILMVPLLFKSNTYKNMLARTIFVDCSEDILIERVKQRSQLSEPQIKSIISTQVPRNQQLALCDDVIDNSHDILYVEQQVEKLHLKYMQLFVNDKNDIKK